MNFSSKDFRGCGPSSGNKSMLSRCSFVEVKKMYDHLFTLSGLKLFFGFFSLFLSFFVSLFVSFDPRHATACQMMIVSGFWHSKPFFF